MPYLIVALGLLLLVAANGKDEPRQDRREQRQQWQYDEDRRPRYEKPLPEYHYPYEGRRERPQERDVDKCIWYGIDCPRY
jgi:hypothetical protein